MKISRKVFLTAAASLCFVASAQSQAMKEINFGIISTDSSTALKSMWQPFMDDMAKATGAAPPHRPSMMQDVLARRPIEVEAQVGQLQAFAREAGVATPVIDAILPLLRGLDRSLTLN